MSTASTSAVPLPPLQVALRSGSTEGPGTDPYADWLLVGRQSRREIERLLGEGWSWEGKRVLDFGCGAGRTLRHFLDVAGTAELHGCDIYAEGIEWLRSNLTPQVSAFGSGERPPLALDEGSVDLVYALSVFTHITDSWADWVCEMHRILAPGGYLIATFIEEVDKHLREDVDPEDEIGMNVIRHNWQWERGGPVVLHSDWWLREHWGRAFELIEMDRDPIHERLRPHRWGLFRRRDDVTPTPERLRRIDPAEPREVASLQHNLRQAQWEIRQSRRALDVIEEYESTLSWRVTRPLRALARMLRGAGD
jgi:SAM-dependent methyltransferase